MTEGPAAGPRFVLGVDSGGSGLRVALAGTAALGAAAEPGRVVASDEPVPTDGGGIDAGRLVSRLLPIARELLAEAGGSDVAAVCVGAAGMATLGGRLRAELPGALAAGLGVRRTVLAADVVTGYVGALGGRPGAVVAAGTGLIALGLDGHRWRRADGWGHLLGDCGGGSWIGRAGLTAALRAHDGRAGGSAALLARAEAVFGPATGLPGLVYPRSDRPAWLASFAPEVARCAAAEPADQVATAILREAAGEIAISAAAVCPPTAEPRIALTGGLLRLGEPLLRPLREELAARLPEAALVPAAGDPLRGALTLAARAAVGELGLPEEPGLLVLHDTPAHDGRVAAR
ncbi:BadF/BadG/BcrA/BcrD ATPase family protein [Streptomyces sp. 8K308]|uniref:N-acetylglucosamine kinase n=1 Tax=Streptomyces sp. 8K308 TaxID=2530388 RepID=UPI001FB73714|nr:BadF/BadG/BcrA/BcrD ATPase family protein [Streptomyces sp. 8K308]